MHRILITLLAVAPSALASYDGTSLLQARDGDMKERCEEEVSGTYRMPTGGLVTMIQGGEKHCLVTAFTSSKAWYGPWFFMLDGKKLSGSLGPNSKKTGEHEAGVITWENNSSKQWKKIEEKDRKGMCDGSQDQEIFKQYGPGNLEDSFNSRVAQCAAQSMDPISQQLWSRDNMTSCLRTNLTLSHHCGFCFVDTQEWIFDNCKKECMTEDDAFAWCTSPCQECRASREAKHSECVGSGLPAAKTCTGLTRLQSGLKKMQDNFRERKLWAGSPGKTLQNVAFRIVTGTMPKKEPKPDQKKASLP